MAANTRKPQLKPAENRRAGSRQNPPGSLLIAASWKHHLLCVNVLPRSAKWLQQFQPSHVGIAASRGTIATFSSWNTLERASLPLTDFSLLDWSELGLMLIYKQVTGGEKWSYCD